jgi:hypothetical protein
VWNVTEREKGEANFYIPSSSREVAQS